VTSVRVPSSPVSGATHSKGRDQRPGFDAMHKDAARRRFDVVMAWSVDRLGRSLQDLCGFLSALHSLGIDLFLHQQGIDTTTPAGKAMFQMMGVFAELERSMIRERRALPEPRPRASIAVAPSWTPSWKGASAPHWLRLIGRACTRSPSSSALVRARCKGLRRTRWDDRASRRRLAAARQPGPYQCLSVSNHLRSILRRPSRSLSLGYPRRTAEAFESAVRPCPTRHDSAVFPTAGECPTARPRAPSQPGRFPRPGRLN
jgi:Resolvase, N terminal domain